VRGYGRLGREREGSLQEGIDELLEAALESGLMARLTGSLDRVLLRAGLLGRISPCPESGRRRRR
jgi:hypothetical protein